MRDIALFARLLALEDPWRVQRASLDTHERSLAIRLAHRRNASFSCPDCGRRAPLYDHAPSRTWRHLDHGDCTTCLHAQVPRVDRPVHGIRRVHVPWAPPGARFTLAFERHAIDVLLEADITGATRLLRISWDEAWHIMERAVERGLRAKGRRIIAHLGADEKAVAKRHRYITLVCDLDRGTVEYIADGRKKSSLDAYYQSLSAEQLAGIEAVAMDMWEPYISSTSERRGERATPGGRRVSHPVTG
jgi:transposase